MKGLKKLALVTAVAAAPFAQAEMTAMDDALLGEMTGQAGITIDVDLDMTIDAIKYVDQDGNRKLELAAGGAGTGDYNADGTENLGAGDYEFTGSQGAITMKGLTIDNDGGTAYIRGITIDADGNDGLVIGLNKIGGVDAVTGETHGIDITVDAVMINNGAANLHMVNTAAAVSFVDQGTGTAGTLNVAQIKTAVPALIGDATVKGGAAQAAGIALATAQGTQVAGLTPTGSNTYTSYADLSAQASTGTGDQAELDAQADLATVDTATATEATAAGTAANTYALANAELNKALAVVAPAGAGNIGGFKIENFRNYIQDELVEKYNGVFDMALNDSEGNLNNGSTAGRYVRGEIVINGTGNYVTGTSGLKISGEFGGAIDEAAWVDEGQEFGIADLGFFHGVDTDADGVSDTIEGMHFTMNIDVVDHQSWDSTAAAGVADVAALQISGLELKGTIMMGSLYLDSQTATVNRESLGSVLIKDIDMSGTSVYVYGH